MITISGILKTPTGDPIAAKLRITSETSKGSVIKGATSTVSIGRDGQYSFSLVKGMHALEVKVCDTFELIGISLVDDSTPTQITLPELLRYTTPLPVPPPEVDDPVWQALIAATQSIEGTTQKELDQIRDDNTVNAHIDSISTLASIKAGYSQSSDVVKVDDTKSSVYRHAYSDANNQKTAKHSVKLATDATSIHEEYTTARTNKGTLTNLFSKSWTTLKSSIRRVLTQTDTYIHEEEHKHVGDDALFDRSHNLDSTGFIDNYTAAVKGKEIERNESIGDTGAYDSVILTDEYSQASHELKINGLPASSTVLKTGDKITSEKLEITTVGSKKTFEVDQLDIGDVLQVDNISKQVTVTGQFVLNAAQYKGERGDTVFQVEQYSIDGKTAWQDDFFEGAVYRRINQSINGVIDPTKWSRAYQFSGKDGQKGDTIYFEYNYAPLDVSVWHTTMQDGDVWRRERIVKDGIPGEWSNPARIRGSDGKNGLIETIEYQYSVDGVTIWHSNFSEGDYYRRERSVVRDSLADPTPEYGVWTYPVKITPERGYDYFDGLNQATIYLYKRVKGTVPDTPAVDLLYNFSTRDLTGELDGWAQSIPPGAENLYVAVATAVSTLNVDTIASTEWTAGLLSSNGADGVDAQIVVPVYQVALSAPPTPTGSAIPPTGWSREAPAQIVGKQKVFVSYTYAGTYTSTTGSGNWSRPAQWSGENGTDGIAGKMVRGVYRSAVKKPRKPEGNAIPPEGWTETVPDLVKGEVIWASYTYADGELATTGTGYWTDVGQWSGKDGSDGLSTARITLYKVSTGIPALHTNTLTYTFATGDVTLPNNGWRIDIPPDMKPGDTLWVTSATVINLASIPSATVRPTRFASPVILTTLGSDGTNGLNQATIYIYKRAKGAVPGTPATDLLYNFSTRKLMGELRGWTQKIPEGKENLYVAVATAVSSAPVDTIASTEWTAGLLSSNGADGIDAQIVVPFFAVAISAPPIPTGKALPPTGWSREAPAQITGKEKVFVSYTYARAYDSLVGSGNWTRPAQWSGENGTDGVDGKMVRGVYKSAVTKPKKPEGIAIPPAGWTETVPDAVKGEVIWACYTYADGELATTGTGYWTDVGQWSGKAGIDGLSTARITLYKVSPVPPKRHTNTLTYTYATGNTTLPNNGWRLDVPSNLNPGDTLWITSATVINLASVPSSTVAPAKFSLPVIFNTLGVDGKNGLNQATLYIYKRAKGTVPDTPATDLVYNFSTRKLTGELSGWTQKIPEGKENLYVAVATAVSSATIDSIASTEWTAGLLSSNGADGIDAQIVVPFFAVAVDAPPIPTGKVLPPPGWSREAPSQLTGKQKVFVSYTYAGAYASTSGSGNWTRPAQWSGENGVDGIAGKMVRGVYKSAVTKPRKPEGIAIPPTGWTETIPDVVKGEVIWACYTYADGETTTTGTGFWTDVGQWAGKDGIDGIDGLSTARITLYKVSPSTPKRHSNTLTYTYATGNTTFPNNGWELDVPSDMKPGDILWVTSATVINLASVPSSTVTPAKFSLPVIFNTLGVNGKDGLNQATIYIYKRAKGTVPATPTADLLYNFSTRKLTGGLSGWTQKIPEGKENLYVAVATVVSNTAIDNIASTEWAAGLLSSNGADGIDAQIVVPFFAVAVNAPSAPTGKALPPKGWLREAPSKLTGKQKVFVSYTYAGTYISTSGSGNWTRPAQWSGENGTDGIAGKMVRGVYKSAATKPKKPEGTAIPPTGWTETVPDAVAGEVIWACYTYADGEVATTGTGFWTDVGQWSGKDGTNGIDGLSTARITLYKVSPIPPKRHSNTLTYTYATGNTTFPNNGWRVSVPSDMKPGDILWITSATVINLASVPYSTILPAKFSLPVIFNTLGVDGKDGLNQATIYIYKRAKGTVPAPPNTDLFYTFSTRKLEGKLNGWSQKIPEGKENLYVAVATTVSNSNVDTIASKEWAAGLMSSNGADGIDAQIVVPFFAVASSAPLTPTGNTLPPKGWLREAPAQLTGRQKVFVSYTYAGAYTSTTGSGNWTRPAQWSGENGVDGIAGKMVRGVYKSAATKPKKPEGLAIPPTGWTETVPDLVKGEVIWACYTYANGEVDTTGTGFWTDVGQWSGKDGTDGAKGADGLSSARVTLYKVSATPPSRHTNTLTYDFATGNTTFPNNGWRLDTPSNMKAGDILWIMRATVINLASVPSSTIAPARFSAPVIFNIVGTDGKDGKDGKDGRNGLDGSIIRGVYTSAVTKPAKPSGTTIPPRGWTESVPYATRGEVVWASYTYARNNTTTTGAGYWTDVGRWSGLDGEPGKDGRAGKDGAPGATGAPGAPGAPGRDGRAGRDGKDGKDGNDGKDGRPGKDGLSFAKINLYKVSKSKPVLPTNTLTFNFNTGYITQPNNGWESHIPSGMQPGDTLWLTSTAVISLATVFTATVDNSLFSDPVIFTTIGADGKNGAGFYSIITWVNPTTPIKNAAVFPTNTKATYDFTRKVGRAPEIDDHLTYKWIHDLDSVRAELRQQELSGVSKGTDPLHEKVLTRRFNGTEWIAPDQILNGDLLVKGTVTADRLNVRELSAITADIGLVTSGTIQTAPDPSGNRAIITSSGDFPLWIGTGAVNEANAVLSYHKTDNTLHVKNIQANGGNFNDVVVSGRVSGAFISSSIFSQNVNIEETGGTTLIPTIPDTKAIPRLLTNARPSSRTSAINPVKTGSTVSYSFSVGYKPADYTGGGTVYGGSIYADLDRFYSYNPYRKFTLPDTYGPFLGSTLGYELYLRGTLVRKQSMQPVRVWCKNVTGPDPRAFYWAADHTVGDIKIHWKFEENEDWIHAIREMWLEIREYYRQTNMGNSEIKLVILTNDNVLARTAKAGSYREQTHNQKTSLHVPDSTGNW